MLVSLPLEGLRHSPWGARRWLSGIPYCTQTPPDLGKASEALTGGEKRVILDSIHTHTTTAQSHLGPTFTPTSLWLFAGSASFSLTTAHSQNQRGAQASERASSIDPGYPSYRQLTTSREIRDEVGRSYSIHGTSLDAPSTGIRRPLPAPHTTSFRHALPYTVHYPITLSSSTLP